MNDETLLSRTDLAKRWRCSTRKVDRLRKEGDLPWLDLTAKKGKRPAVRFHLEQIIKFETRCLMSIGREEGGKG